MIPYILMVQVSSTIDSLVIAGCAVWLIGFLTEATADFQKFNFSSKPSNKNKWIEQGVWKYSRHPNYFGEILVWVGTYIIASQSLSAGYATLALISPLFITTLLLFVSGIPILEKSADKRWGNDKKYRSYKRATSILIPLPKRPVR